MGYITICTPVYIIVYKFRGFNNCVIICTPVLRLVVLPDHDNE